MNLSDTRIFGLILVTVILAILFSLSAFRRTFSKLIDKLARNLVRRGQRSKVKMLSGGGPAIHEPVYTFDDLTRNITRSALSIFPVSMAAVYLYDAVRDEFTLRSEQRPVSSKPDEVIENTDDLAISAADPLIKFIGFSRDLVTSETIASKTTMADQRKEILGTLERMRAAVCAPLINAGQVKGLLVFGDKKNEERFTADDFTAILGFARMGDEILRYVSGMEAELNYSALYAHDMNNDTKSLVQTLEFLQSPMASGQPRHKILQLLSQAEDVAIRVDQSFELTADRSALLIKSIRGEYKKSQVDIAKCIRAAHAKYALFAQKKNVSIKINIPPTPVFVNGNPADLLRIFENLLSNALRSVNVDGQVDLICEVTGGNFEVIVRDNGPRTDAQDVQRIWIHGWQTKNTRQGVSAFRLSIARQIVHLHGGRIHVSANSGGVGTEFHVSIPLMQRSSQVKMGSADI